MDENKIIRDLRVLTEEFIPSRIIHRDSQLDSLKSSLAPLIDGEKPRHSFLYGPPGTGKTSLSLFAAEELKKQTPVSFSYINCWHSATRFSILYNILRGLGLFVQRKGVPTDEMVETFRNKTRGRTALVILDEADRLEEPEILYDLISSGAGLILISNSESALYNVDARIRSRLSSMENIQFHKYAAKELADIIKDRREWGLLPNTLSNKQADTIAQMANGDARIALSILSVAARKAEDKDLDKVTDQLLESSFPHAINDSRRRTMDSLNEHQRIIIEGLKEGEKTAVELMELLAKKTDKEIVDRTFRKYMERLVRHGIVTFKGEGRWRTYSLK